MVRLWEPLGVIAGLMLFGLGATDQPDQPKPWMWIAAITCAGVLPLLLYEVWKWWRKQS